MDLVNVAQKIRQLRRQQQLTVDQLAARSGLSKGYISRVENFRTRASLRALNLVAAALGVELIDLFRNEDAAPEYVFGRIDQGEFIDRNQGLEYGMKYFALAFNKTDRRMNPFFIEYRPCDHERELMQHDSQEFFIVLEGELDYRIGSPENARRMVKGDTLYLDARLPHGAVLADGCQYAAALAIYY
jgi:transcriptional regulator with XRE-family HTH domain